MRAIGIAACVWMYVGISLAQVYGVNIKMKSEDLSIGLKIWYTIKALSKAIFYGPLLKNV
jgi:hypothetical protein